MTASIGEAFYFRQIIVISAVNEFFTAFTLGGVNESIKFMLDGYGANQVKKRCCSTAALDS